jgi:hypothetical protein
MITFSTGAKEWPMRTNASTGKIRQTYEFIKANRKRFDASTRRASVS